MEELITENLVLRKARLSVIWNNIWRDKKIAETMLWEVTKTHEENVF